MKLENLEQRLTFCGVQLKQLIEEPHTWNENIQALKYAGYVPPKELSDKLFNDQISGTRLSLFAKLKWSKIFKTQIPKKIIRNDLINKIYNGSFEDLGELMEEIDGTHITTTNEKGKIQIRPDEVANGIVEANKYGFKYKNVKPLENEGINLKELPFDEEQKEILFTIREFEFENVENQTEWQQEQWCETVKYLGIKPPENVTRELCKRLGNVYGEVINKELCSEDNRNKRLEKLNNMFLWLKTNVQPKIEMYAPLLEGLLNDIDEIANMNNERYEERLSLFNNLSGYFAKDIQQSKKCADVINEIYSELSNTTNHKGYDNKYEKISHFTIYSIIENYTGVSPSEEVINQTIKTRMNKNKTD